MPRQIIMEEEETRLSVVDVYDLASEIGKEFEKIIDNFGSDAVTGLMPRVISSLEHLEKLTTKNENVCTYIQELKSTITHLENEKIRKAEDRLRYEKELEEIEDRLREESHELVVLVARLQEENRVLSRSLARSEEDSLEVLANGSCMASVDMKVVSQLQHVVEIQRQQMHTKENNFRSVETQLETLKLQLDKLNLQNRDFRRRQRISACQIRSLIDERVEVQAELQEEKRKNLQLTRRLGSAQKDNDDMASLDSIDLNTKLVFDRDDPERPRFTLKELRDILYERNELKARVSDLEDELSLYRPGAATPNAKHWNVSPLTMGGLEPGEEPVVWGALGDITPPDSLVSQFHDVADDEADEADAPVQGPMPYEPEDAPWKKREESGIHKFFRRLFGDDSNSNGTPKRSLLGFTLP